MSAVTSTPSGATAPNRAGLPQRDAKVVYAATILLSSFLLFQIQPIFARLILPWFGGSAGVWTACMLFFQAALLLGYLYAHWSIGSLSPRTHLAIHMALLVCCVVLLPVSPSARWRPAGSSDPTLRIIALLAANIGLPYFALSSTGPLVQAWYARAFGATPYRLFALSNAGSALALLTYPVLVEPFFAGRIQTRAWSALFAAFAVCCGATAWMSYRRPPGLAVAGPAQGCEACAAGGRPLAWTALAACGSALLLSVTNFLSRDVAPVPFLWVLPLFLYLLSFILCFDARGWYRRNVFLCALPAAIGPIAYFLWPEGPKPGLWWMIAASGAGFFVCAMVCHGELARLRPAPRHLTSYFLSIAAGGASGGLFVGVLAPHLFDTDIELQAGLVLCLALAVLRVCLDPPAALAARRRLRGSLFALPACLIVFFALAAGESARDSVFAGRNFYGSVRVDERVAQNFKYRVFVHGVINHGEQWFEDDLQHDPVSYFCGPSGIGQVLAGRPDGRRLHVGVVGLGVGTLAAYAHPGDRFRFYEINPLVAEAAGRWFTYLRECRARTEIVLGDGRLSLEREPRQEFDVLALDAFSGDSIPVHLLTREAFAQYFRHLKYDGVLAVQATNRYVDLAPLLGSMAASFGKTARLVEDSGDPYGVCFLSRWVLISGDARRPALRNAKTLRPSARIAPWTDDYSNVLQVLR